MDGQPKAPRHGEQLGLLPLGSDFQIPECLLVVGINNNLLSDSNTRFTLLVMTIMMMMMTMMIMMMIVIEIMMIIRSTIINTEHNAQA